MDTTEEENKKDKPEESNVTPKTPTGGFAVFQNRYFIDLSKELKEYSTTEVKAYSTGTSQSKASGFFTMICNPKYTPRTNVTQHYQSHANSTLPQLVAYGRAIMPNNTAGYVYIYKDTLGQRLYKNDTDIAKGWKTDKILENLLIPIVMSLKDIQQRDVTHGNIRASNLYNGGADDHSKIKLGECLSTPASFNQPVVYEPISRAMADPIGRGEGTIKDDLYSLGVLLAMHVRNFDPLKGKTDDEIITAKVVTGSYSALVGSSDRISSGISDLIRGLLTDIEKNRWSLEEVLGWLDGQRLNAKQTTKAKKAARGIKFDGTNFFYAKTLAHRLFQKPQDAAALIEGNELIHWIERSLSDKEMLNRVDLATLAAKEGGSGVGHWDRLLPLVSIALDPDAPLRYRSMALNLDAIGNVMASSFMQKKGLNNFVDLFSSGIIYFWLTTLEELNTDTAGIRQKFDKIRGFLRQRDMTNGIERCLYYLNPSIHCLSPTVSEYFATTPTEFAISLESAAESYGSNYPEKIIDQHTACFLISRDSRLVEPHAFDLSSDQDYRYTLACLNILTSIQRFNDVPPLPHVTKWICKLLEPVIDRYHDTEYQNKIHKDLLVKKETGILQDILTLVESPEKVKKDQITYRRAIVRYRELENEKVIIAKKLKKPKYFAERTGREWAATISGIISTLVIIGFLIVHYSGGAT